MTWRNGLFLSLILITSTPAQVLETVALGNRREQTQYRELLGRLRLTRISVDWKDRSLADVLADLRSRTGLNLLVQSGELGEILEQSVDLRLKEVSVEVVLELLSSGRDLVFQNRKGVIHVTSRAHAVRRSAVLAIFDVSDLLYVPPDFPAPKIGIPVGPPSDERDARESHPESKDPEELIDLIKSATGEKNWEYEGVSIRHSAGKLLIRHTPAMLRRIGGVIRSIG